MKNKAIKKNTFIEGTLIASISFIIIKILGALYVIPFYKIIGEEGGVLYSYAYNIYNLFLNISTAGIPVAISMIISEYLALEMYDAKERAYSVSKKIICIIALVSFSIVFFGSTYLAKFLISDVSGGHSIEDISLVIKSISFCLLIIPFLSVLRGYFQGHKFISATSYSQVIEQVIRILVVIFGSYISLNILNNKLSVGVSVSLTGAFFGGVISYIYLKNKLVKNKDAFVKSDKKDLVSNKLIAKKILSYCIPLIIVAVIDNLYTLVDVKLIIKGLNMIGYNAMESQIVSGIVSTWAPKICTIIIAISMALTTNIIPHVTTNYVKGDLKGVNYRINQAILTMLTITIPMSILLFLLSNEAYYIFYGDSNYGSLILKISSISHIFFGIWSVINTSLQGMKKFKIIYINSFVGLFINALLDIPLILLFNKVGIAPYVATIVSTCIGYFISILIATLYLKKNLDFHFGSILRVIKNILISSICLIIPIVISKMFIKFDYTLISSIISVIIHGMFGAIIYLFICYKNGVLYEVFGKEFVDNILIKLHLKKLNRD